MRVRFWKEPASFCKDTGIVKIGNVLRKLTSILGREGRCPTRYTDHLELSSVGAVESCSDETLQRGDRYIWTVNDTEIPSVWGAYVLVRSSLVHPVEDVGVETGAVADVEVVAAPGR